MVAVAARDLNRAKEFAQKYNIPKAYGSYEELAKDPNVGEWPGYWRWRQSWAQPLACAVANGRRCSSLIPAQLTAVGWAVLWKGLGSAGLGSRVSRHSLANDRLKLYLDARLLKLRPSFSGGSWGWNLTI